MNILKIKSNQLLLKKKVVICDRFVDSTIAYQVYGKKVNINFINNIHKKILKNIKPNIVFVLKVSKKTSRKDLERERQIIGMIILLNPFIQKLKNLLLKLQKIKKIIIY